MLEWGISEEEFKELFDCKVFQIINDKCNLMIDDFESDVIDKNSLESAVKCIQELYDQNPSDTLKKLLIHVEKALECETLVALDF